MSLLARLLTVATASLMFAAAAYAGPVADFEKSMRAAYADYRAALFQTNANNRDEAVKTIDRFRQKWADLVTENPKAPPQYADDNAYATTLAKVTELAESAATQAAAGTLADAHVTLEGIRNQIGGLHERNGVIAFSDRMNAYHAKMEQVLAKDYSGFNAAGLGELREDAAVLAYLISDISAHPPAEAADPAYRPALDGVSASVTSLAEAAQGGDGAAAKRAVSGLKMPYSKLFLKFG